MGEAERKTSDLGDLIRVADSLSPERRAELVDFAAFLAAREKHERPIAGMPDEERVWLDAAAADTADRIAALEDDLPVDKVRAWHEEVEGVAKPARYIPGVGLVVEGQYE